MLENLMTHYANWKRLGEVMSKRPVKYFQNTGEYAGYLRTLAYFENKIADQLELESEDGIVEVKKVDKRNYY